MSTLLAESNHPVFPTEYSNQVFMNSRSRAKSVYILGASLKKLEDPHYWRERLARKLGWRRENYSYCPSCYMRSGGVEESWVGEDYLCALCYLREKIKQSEIAQLQDEKSYCKLLKKKKKLIKTKN